MGNALETLGKNGIRMDPEYDLTKIVWGYLDATAPKQLSLTHPTLAMGKGIAIDTNMRADEINARIVENDNASILFLYVKKNTDYYNFHARGINDLPNLQSIVLLSMEGHGVTDNTISLIRKWLSHHNTLQSLRLHMRNGHDMNVIEQFFEITLKELHLTWTQIDQLMDLDSWHAITKWIEQKVESLYIIIEESSTFRYKHKLVWLCDWAILGELDKLAQYSENIEPKTPRCCSQQINHRCGTKHDCLLCTDETNAYVNQRRGVGLFRARYSGYTREPVWYRQTTLEHCRCASKWFSHDLEFHVQPQHQLFCAHRRRESQPANTPMDFVLDRFNRFFVHIGSKNIT